MDDLDLLVCPDLLVIHDHHDHHFILHKHSTTLLIDTVLELNHHQLHPTRQQPARHVHQHQITLLEQPHCLHLLPHQAAPPNHAAMLTTLRRCHVCGLHINKFLSQPWLLDNLLCQPAVILHTPECVSGIL